jgi:SAM-dependent MidA family methyltransferase
VVDSELLGVQVFDQELQENIPAPGQGPLVAARHTAPDVEYPTIVLANELLDNLPFDVVDEQGQPVLVSVEDDQFVWLGQPCRPSIARAINWVAEQLVAPHPVVVWAIDYTRKATDDFERSLDWLRTYRAGGCGSSPLSDPGAQDITTDVPVDQLPTPQRVCTQAEWLTDLGAMDLRAKANDQWLRNAHAPMLADLKIKSRVTEIDRLIDPTGLGGFTVLEWRN